jgi:hypothetical protein
LSSDPALELRRPWICSTGSGFSHWYLLFTTVLSACATGAPDKDLDTELREITAQDGRTCISNQDIKTFGDAGDHTATIRASGGSYYVLTMRGACRHLSISADVQLDPRDHELCGVRGDRIIVDGGTCLIKSIFEFPGKDEAYLAVDDAQSMAIAE